MSHSGVTLTSKQVAAISALLEVASIRAAAKQIGMSERTLHRWMLSPVFVAALREAEHAALSGAVRALSGDLDANFRLMRAVRDDSSQAALVRLRAAQVLDDSHRRWRELTVLEERLVELERRMGIDG